jgi:hypothetical protein
MIREQHPATDTPTRAAERERSPGCSASGGMPPEPSGLTSTTICSQMTTFRSQQPFGDRKCQGEQTQLIL